MGRLPTVGASLLAPKRRKSRSCWNACEALEERSLSRGGPQEDELAKFGGIPAAALTQNSLPMTDAMNDDSQGDVALKTIMLSDREIRAAARLLNALVGDDRGKEFSKLAQVNFQTTGNHDRAILVERARQTFVNRARRGRNLNSVMFGEAAWDMLLALYATEHSTRYTVTGLVNLSGLPHTTALRWLDFLEKKEELVTRSPSLSDRRIHHIELTDKARDALDAYFSGTAPEGM